MTTTTTTPPAAPSGRRHRSRRSALAVEPPAGLPFDTAVEVLVYSLLVFAPLAFGTMQAWSREVFFALVAAAALVVAAKHLAAAWAGDRSGYRWSWAYSPIVLFLILCGLQLVPVSTAVMSVVSPNTVRLRAQLLSDLPAEALRRATVSFYPWATRQQIVLVAAVAALFVIVLDVFRDEARIRRLLAVIAGTGLAVSGLAAYQNLSGSETVYGIAKLSHAINRNSGPFMNYSHFSQSVNLAMGAGLALLLVQVAELSEFYRSPAEWPYALRERRHWPMLAWAGLCVLGPVTILACRSRMGAISSFAAAAVTGAVLAWRTRPTAADQADGRHHGSTGRAWPLVGLAVVVFAVALGVGFDQFYDRLATAGDLNTSGKRAEILRDLLPVFKQFPFFGTGLGTHEVVFPQFDTRGLAQTASHAENEYAQLMEETGAVGLAMAVAFIGLLVANYVRATRKPTDPFDYAAFGIGFGLVAILLHSGTDFGQHAPANAAVTATFAAVLATLARRRSTRRARARAAAANGRAFDVVPGGSTAAEVATPVEALPARRIGPVLGHGLTVAALGVAAVAVVGWADRARTAEGFWWQAADRGTAVAADPRSSDAAVAEMVAVADAAVDHDPGNVLYRHQADDLRWQQLERRIDPVTGHVSGDDASFLAGAAAIDADVRRSRELCPTFGVPLYLAGEVAIKLGRQAEGERLILASYRLNPNQPETSLAAGLVLVARPGEEAAAEAAFRQYMTLGGGVREFVGGCLWVSKPQIVWDLIKDDRRSLLYFATLMPEDKPAWAGWVKTCRQRAAILLAKEAARPDASAEAVAEQAAVDRAAGRLQAALDGYQRATNAQFGNVAWRFELARCLVDAGRLDEAAKNLRVCLQQRREMPEAYELLARCEGGSNDAHGRVAPAATAP